MNLCYFILIAILEIESMLTFSDHSLNTFEYLDVRSSSTSCVIKSITSLISDHRA